jgi:hypothetical protein
MTTETLRSWSFGLKLTVLSAAVIAAVVAGILLFIR